MLLRRSTRSAASAIERLVGMQAQTPNAPYFGLWTRLEDFRPDDLSTLVSTRRVVRIALMRSTIHLVTARDCLRLRPLLQPVLDRDVKGTFRQRLAGINMVAIAAAGRALVEEQPRTFGQVGALLRKRWPARDAEALAQAVRARVPLVQVPPRGLWGTGGPAAHTSAEAWLSRDLAATLKLDELVLRYLAAFGPASVLDVQAWSGLARLRDVVERLRPRLRTFLDEHGHELFDLPDAPRPDPDTPAPPRFLPEFDNVLLSHANRRRIIPQECGTRFFGSGGLLVGTVLVDGFVGARWKIARERSTATLIITPVNNLTRHDCAALTEEGGRLLTFAAPDAEAHDVQFASNRQP
jgi:hypothetical protein